MAYLPNRLKAVAGGSAITPSIFTYRSNDPLAEIIANGYFTDAFGIFEIADIIFVNHSNDTSYAKIICTTKTAVPGGVHDIEFIQAINYLGDTRATDNAGFESKHLSLAMMAGERSFNLYTFRNNTDALATILAADYFLDAAPILNPGDILEVIANDLSQEIRVLTSSAAGVTTEAITFL